MKLRFVTYKNNVCASEIKDHFDNTPGLRWLAESKSILENVYGPVLEYYDESTDKWFEVPAITIYRD